MINQPQVSMPDREGSLNRLPPSLMQQPQRQAPPLRLAAHTHFCPVLHLRTFLQAWCPAGHQAFVWHGTVFERRRYACRACHLRFSLMQGIL